MVAKNGSVSKTNIKNDYFDKFGEPETKIFGQFWFWFFFSELFFAKKQTEQADSIFAIASEFVWIKN